MEGSINATLSRIQEIEARLGIFNTQEAAQPAAPQTTSKSALFNPMGGNQPFDVMLAQKNGAIQLKSLSGIFTPEIDNLITRYSAQNGLSPELVRAVVQAESDGNPRCVSAVGAKGLMQLMPENCKTFGVQDPFDPEQNVAAGTRYLSGLLREFNGNIPNALAAYNAGSGAVRKYNGIPPYPETQQYVRKIMRAIGQE